ncbi:MAG: AAA family ATPase [Anaerolineales bacterium]|nr:AAA family ATPase [Anaerolineales bacterium]
MTNEDNQLRIAIVGPCGAGKTTLAENLKGLGYNARQIAQEHSYVPEMWQRITRPDLLIYLDASHQTAIDRKQINWTRREHNDQVHRLRHAREHCDIYIDTESLSTDMVLEQVLEFIQA